MPDGKKHHTDKWRRCVDEVMGKGHDESSASAICTTSLQNAGENIFDGVEARSAEEMRLLGDSPGHPFHGNQYTTEGGETHPLLNERFRTSRDAEKAAKRVALDTGRATETYFSQAEPAGRKYSIGYIPGKTEQERNPGESDDQYLMRIIGLEGIKAAEQEDPEIRELHLCGATGQVRYETLNGRRHLVVPVVALMEGVIHPVNADTPEFVSADVLRRAAASWVGKPVTLGHPKKNGTQCSASEPDIRKSAGLGVLMKSEFSTNKKLLQEAWIDEEKARQLHPALYKDLEDGKPVEVSVGAFVVTRAKESDFNGKRFKAEWMETQGDHLAFLPGGRGACSCDMGCGTHRAAMHLVTAEAIEVVSDGVAKFAADVLALLAGHELKAECAMCKGLGNLSGNPCEACDGEGFLKAAAGARHSGSDMKMIQTVHDHAAALGATCDRKNLETMEDVNVLIDGKVVARAVAGQVVTTAAASVISPERVRREGVSWVLYSTDGKRRLATHSNEADAREQARDLEASLAKACG